MAAESITSQRPLSEELHRSWGWLLALGIIFIALGFLAMRAAFITTLGVVVFLGGLLTVGGIAELVHAFRTRKWGGFLMNLLGGVLTLAVGIMLLMRPVVGAASITLVFGAFLVAIGLFRASSAATIRFEQWGWYLLSGIITFILGLLILLQWPVSSLWIIGLFVGIEFVILGWSTLMLAFAARRLPEGPVAHA